MRASPLPAARRRAQQQLPSEPPRQFGTSITGAFEGWFDDPDGTHNFLVGYLNRNMKQAMDVPIGPEQPHRAGRARHGAAVALPAGPQDRDVPGQACRRSSAPQERLTWTIVVNGQSTVIPLRLHTDYNVSPFGDVAVGNTPPHLRFEEKGQPLQGPVATLDKAVPRTRPSRRHAARRCRSWVTDDAKYLERIERADARGRLRRWS